MLDRELPDKAAGSYSGSSLQSLCWRGLWDIAAGSYRSRGIGKAVLERGLWEKQKGALRGGG